VAEEEASRVVLAEQVVSAVLLVAAEVQAVVAHPPAA
jgi:hypothetical protein